MKTTILPGHLFAQFYVVDEAGLPLGSYVIREDLVAGITIYTVHANGTVPEVALDGEGNHDGWISQQGVIQHAQNLVWHAQHEADADPPELVPVPGKPGWFRQPGSIALFRVDL